MPDLAVDLALIGVAALLLLLYWNISRAHISAQFKQPNDHIVHVPFLHLQTSRRPHSTVYGDIRCRHYSHSYSHRDDSTNTNDKSVWIVFIASSDSLDIFDVLINQFLDTFIHQHNDDQHTFSYSTIHLLTYDRIGYGSSSSLHTLNHHKLCISPPTFHSITAHDRALELLSLLMNINIEDESINLYRDDLILVGSMFGGLIAQSFLNVIANDFPTFYPERVITNRCNTMNVKLLLLDSPWIGIDGIIDHFKIRTFDCFKDYLMTMLGLQQRSALNTPFPSMEHLRNVHGGYEGDLLRNLSIVRYYRGHGNQIVSQWSELLGFWDSFYHFGKDREEWGKQIRMMCDRYGIDTVIYNLYSEEHVNAKWKEFHQNLSAVIDGDYLRRNQCVPRCRSYIYLEQPQYVLDAIGQLLRE